MQFQGTFYDETTSSIKPVAWQASRLASQSPGKPVDWQAVVEILSPVAVYALPAGHADPYR